jgi:hypothetical protein
MSKTVVVISIHFTPVHLALNNVVHISYTVHLNICVLSNKNKVPFVTIYTSYKLKLLDLYSLFHVITYTPFISIS